MNLEIAGTVLKQKRLQKEMTLQDVSDKAGLTKGYLSQIEHGDMKNPSLNALLALCEALDISFYSLVGSVERIDSELPKKKQKKKSLKECDTWQNFNPAKPADILPLKPPKRVRIAASKSGELQN